MIHALKFFLEKKAKFYRKKVEWHVGKTHVRGVISTVLYGKKRKRSKTSRNRVREKCELHTQSNEKNIPSKRETSSVFFVSLIQLLTTRMTDRSVYIQKTQAVPLHTSISFILILSFITTKAKASEAKKSKSCSLAWLTWTFFVSLFFSSRYLSVITISTTVCLPRSWLRPCFMH